MIHASGFLPRVVCREPIGRSRCHDRAANCKARVEEVPVGTIEEVARTVRFAVHTWQGTVRLCLVLLSGGLAGGVFLAVFATISRYAGW